MLVIQVEELFSFPHSKLGLTKVFKEIKSISFCSIQIRNSLRHPQARH